MRSKVTKQQSLFSISRQIEIARCILLFLADMCVLSIPYCSLNKGKNRVLIVRLDSVGDFVLWLDAAKELRRLYPSHSYEITLLGNQAWCELAAELPYFDQVWPLDRRKFIGDIFYRLAVLKKIRKTGFRTVINPTYSREFFLGDEIVRVCGAIERIGYESNCSNSSHWGLLLSDSWYTQIIPATHGLVMELVRNAEFVRKLGLADFLAAVPELKKIASCNEILLPVQYFVIVPGAGASLRQWPISQFKEVAKRIYHLTGWEGVVCGASGEENLGTDLICNINIPIVNLVGKTSLAELITVIAGANIVVGNESSAVHLAATVLTPAVCVLGGGHYGRFLPYQVEVPTCNPQPVPVFYELECFGCDWRCIYELGDNEPAPCVARVSVDMVMAPTVNIIREILNQNG